MTDTGDPTPTRPSHRLCGPDPDRLDRLDRAHRPDRLDRADRPDAAADPVAIPRGPLSVPDPWASANARQVGTG